jgi:hypothetical protein
VRGITLKHATSPHVNFDTIHDTILGITTDKIITVHTERKIKTRGSDGTGLLGTDAVALVSENEKNVYQVSF